MKNELFTHNITIKQSPIHGYGVFAAHDILEGEIVEESHLILFDKKNKTPESTNYLFKWEEDSNALALGYGSIYNHSDNPNVSYTPDFQNNIMVFKAIRTIKVGEEILSSYGKDWFNGRNIIPKNPTSKPNCLSFNSTTFRSLLISLIILVIILLLSKF